MPIEIKELHIKVNVDETPRDQRRPIRHRPGNNNDELVATCVEKVLEILKREEQR